MIILNIYNLNKLLSIENIKYLRKKQIKYYRSLHL